MRLAAGQVGPAQNIPYDRLVTIGQTFEAQGNYDKAERMYRLVLSKQPNNVQASHSIHRVMAMRSNNGRVFDGSMYQQPSVAPAMPVMPQGQGQPTHMLAGQPGPNGIQMVSATVVAPATAAPVPAKPKSKSVLTAASTVPIRTKTTRVRTAATTDDSEEFAVPIVRTTATRPANRAALPREEWTLPRVAPSPNYAHPETGRVRLENTNVAAAPVQESLGANVYGSTQTAAPAQINIEACLDNPSLHVDKLARALSAADPDVRSLAAFLLGEAGNDAISALPQLKTRLSSEADESIRISMAEGVAKIDKADVQAKTTLLAGLRSTNTAVRSQAAFGLRVYAAAVGSQPTVDALTTALSDSDGDVVAMAALSLSDFGTNGKSALPGLEAAKAGATKEVQDALNAAITRING